MDNEKMTLEKAVNKLRENGMGDPDAFVLIAMKGEKCVVNVYSEKDFDGMMQRIGLVKAMKDLLSNELGMEFALTTVAEGKGFIKSIKASAVNGEDAAESIIKAAEELLKKDEDE